MTTRFSSRRRGQAARFEPLEPRLLLTSVRFVEQTEIPTERVFSVVVSDFTGDERPDLVTLNQGSNDTTAQARLLRNEGEGQFSDAVTLELQVEANHFTRIISADLDGDMDQDILMRYRSANTNTDVVAVAFNEDGQGSFGPATSLLSKASLNFRSVQAADLDDNGHIDIVVAYDNTLSWFSNANGEFGDEQILTTTAERPDWITPADIDQDGDADLLLRSAGAVGFLRNDGGDFQSFRPIAKDVFGSPIAADIDTDGDTDVIVAGRWYENLGDGSFADEPSHEGPQFFFFSNTEPVDLDADGDIDFLSAHYYSADLDFVENLGGKGVFQKHRIGQGFPIATADMDGDGDIDILVRAMDGSGLRWLANVPNVELQFLESQHQQSLAGESIGLELHVTNRSDEDISDLTVNFNLPSEIEDVAWTCVSDLGASCLASGTAQSDTVELPVGSQVVYSLAGNIVDSAAGTLVASAAVLFGVASISDDEPILVRPLGFPLVAGSERFSVPHVFDNGAMDIELADFDGDGDVDALMAYDNLVQLVNDGKGAFEQRHQGGGYSYEVAVGDVDGDGDPDAVTSGDYLVVWRNDVGRLTRDNRELEVYSMGLELGDMDDDGDLDAVIATEDGIVVATNDGLGIFSLSESPLIATDMGWLDLGDVDQDGDLDIFASGNGSQDYIIINDPGDSFSVLEIPSAGGELRDLVDLDADGRLDALGQDILWNDEQGFRRGQTLTDASGVDVVDFDGDGDLDVLTLTTVGIADGTPPPFFSRGTVWLNQGDRTFIRKDIPITNAEYAIRAVDVEGDGDLDLITGGGTTKVFYQIEEQGDVFVSITPFEVSRAGEDYQVSTRMVVANANPNVTPSPLQLNPEFIGFESMTWECTPSEGSVCSDNSSSEIAGPISVAPNGQLTYEITGTVDPMASRLAVEVDLDKRWYSGDIDPENDKAAITGVDSDRSLQIIAQDLQYVEGAYIATYTIEVMNSADHPVWNVKLGSDTRSFSDIEWICSASEGSTCSPTGSEAFEDTVALAPGGRLEYDITATVDAEASFLSFSPRLQSPQWLLQDNNSRNNSAFHRGVESDRLVTINDQGLEFQDDKLVAHYTVVVANSDHYPAKNVRLNTRQSGLVDVEWSCTPSPGSTCTESGSGDLEDTVDLAAAGWVTYDVTAQIQLDASRIAFSANLGGWLANDANFRNNSSAVNGIASSRTLRLVDHDIRFIDGQHYADYEIILENSDHHPVADIVVEGKLLGLSQMEWSCSASEGSTCAKESDDELSSTVSLAAGGTVTYLVSAQIDVESDEIALVAELVSPVWLLHGSGVTELAVRGVPSDRAIALDRQAVVPMGDGYGITYKLVVVNSDDHAVDGLEVVTTSAGLADITWTCEGPSGVCANAGDGPIRDTISLDAGGWVLYDVSARIDENMPSFRFRGSIVGPGWLVGDSAPSNNSASASGHSSDFIVNVNSRIADGARAFEIVVQNSGSDSVPLEIKSEQSGFTGLSWTCQATEGSRCSESGTGAPVEEMFLQAGGELVYLVTGTEEPSARTATLSAQIVGPPWALDRITSNNNDSISVPVLPLLMNPTPNSFQADPDGDVVLTRKLGDIDDADLDELQIDLRGSQSGLQVAPQVTVTATEVRIAPTTSFLAGERITLTVRGLKTTGGLEFAPYTGEFQIAARASSGEFQASGNPLPTPAQAAGDVDRDGDLDVVADNLWLNDGRGGFSDTGISLAEDAFGVQLVDLNNDGWLDVHVDRDQNEIWLNDQNGTFTRSSQAFDLVPERSVRVYENSVIADFDADGDLDIITAGPTLAESRLWINDGDANFTRSGVAFGGSNLGFAGIAADANGDGTLDLLHTSQLGTIRLDQNDGQANFTPGQRQFGVPVGFDLGDIDDDGDIDVLLHDTVQSHFWVNDGAGQLTSGQRLANTRGGELADIDGDGDLDVVSTSESKDTEIWRNDGQGVFTFSDQTLGTGPAGNNLISGDFDGDGDIDLMLDGVLHRNQGNASDLIGDIDGNGFVNFDDFLVLSANFGVEVAPSTMGDLDDNGLVNFDDFLILSANFGETNQQIVARAMHDSDAAFQPATIDTIFSEESQPDIEESESDLASPLLTAGD